ncbi:hypothetical protein [Microvirga tunisiensis]|uniref:Uncharacterized protein n=1 Tax=Microvirga tunisiensis TaxID=2108360 RepID=A0A5N7MJA5_9HYPH|nr:hypothetical protein [Microvirga tunisiensis]MPR08945.1 hypothetical protein [Microvirga tunisiensis]MPR27125.1 hypothetical protein [Microvirga tunisiensis]
MASLGPEQIEAEARAILSRRIERLGWFPGLSEEERRERIAQGVELYWPTMVQEAAHSLLDGLKEGRSHE